MRIFVVVLFGIFGVAYSVAQVLRFRRNESDAMSDQWVTAQDRRDAITRGYFEGVVGRWPINREVDDKECA